MFAYAWHMHVLERGKNPEVQKEADNGRVVTVGTFANNSS